jgi:hypothetical protein
LDKVSRLCFDGTLPLILKASGGELSFSFGLEKVSAFREESATFGVKSLYDRRRALFPQRLRNPRRRPAALYCAIVRAAQWYLPR